jgi:hypothetical protein
MTGRRVVAAEARRVLVGIRSALHAVLVEEIRAMNAPRCPGSGSVGFLHHDGAVEQIRRDHLTTTHEPYRCVECRAWHVVPRSDMRSAA